MWLKEPLTCVLEWNFDGPLLTVTLWRRTPAHRQVTFVPFEIFSVLGVNRSSLTFTVLPEAPNADTAENASSAVVRASSTKTRRSRRIRLSIGRSLGRVPPPLRQLPALAIRSGPADERHAAGAARRGGNADDGRHPQPAPQAVEA